MNNLLFATLLALIPSVVWIFFWWQKDNQKEPPMILLQAFMLGSLCGLILLPLRYALPEMPLTLLLFLTALLEETIKAAATILVTEKNYRLFDQVIDGIIYGVTVALGFAFVENIVYLTEFLHNDMDANSFWVIYFLRATTTTFAHSIFTGMFGFAYANAYLLPDDFIPEIYHGKPFCCVIKKMSNMRYRLKAIYDVLTLHLLFAHLLRNAPSTYKHSAMDLILEGIVSAIYLHLLFDVLAMLEIGGQTIAFLLPGLVLLTGWRLMLKFGLRKYREIIHRSWAPSEGY